MLLMGRNVINITYLASKAATVFFCRHGQLFWPWICTG